MKTLAFFLGALVAPAAAQDIPSQPRIPDSLSFERPATAPAPAPVASLDVTVTGIKDGKPIPDRFAYCRPDGKGRTVNGNNISPAIQWRNAPEETKSFVLLVTDADVPASFESANQPGQDIPLDFPRQNFYHWVLTDIPVTTLALYEGVDSKAVTPGGKLSGARPYGINGRNDYAKLSPGPNGGYDGPCPPWNDLRLHHYRFTVYALDIPSLNLPHPATGPQALAAMEGHILAKGEVTGTYSTHPRWIPQLKKDLKEQAAQEAKEQAEAKKKPPQKPRIPQ